MTHVFTLPGNRWEGVHANLRADQLRGYVWVLFDKSAAKDQLSAIQRDTLFFGMIWIAASAVLVLLMGRTITRPLAVLHRGTTALMTAPEDGSRFPVASGRSQRNWRRD